MASQITPSEGQVIRVPIFPGTEAEWDSHGSSLRLEESTATLRCDDENSSAKIVINNFSFRFIQHFNRHAPHISRQLGCWMLHACSRFIGVGCWKFTFKNPLRPFNYRHTIRLQKFLQPGGHHL